MDHNPRHAVSHRPRLRRVSERWPRIFLEDGSEVYNVLDRNLAVQAYVGQPLPGQVLPYDPNDGSGFWWANPLNTFTRNVATECDRYGSHYEVKPYAFPLARKTSSRCCRQASGTSRWKLLRPAANTLMVFCRP